MILQKVCTYLLNLQLLDTNRHLSSPICLKLSSSGEILIDNHNIKDLDLKFLRKNIGAVSQEPSLFAGTIKDNMKVGKMDAEDEDIQKASVMANAHTFISQLPDQYSTEVSYSMNSLNRQGVVTIC